MNFDATGFSILWPALAAGLLVTATHVPLGMQVLARGIVFIDLAVAQVAGVGVILADALGWEPTGAAVQVAALSAALACALLLTWTERRWPEVQEAIIGVVFVLASSAAVLLLAKNPHGGEHLKDLLVGQILWVNPAQLPLAALVYGVILALWFGLRERLGRVGFYVIFACTVTVSVQLVGLYLVFITLVVPALATWYARRRRLLKGYLIGVLGYALGLAASLAADLPSGPMIVCAIVALGLLVFVLDPRRMPDARA
jgi:zinc/manganese transport system permease protein